MATINDHRKKIDSIDDEILKLLSERGKIAQKIGELKKKSGEIILVPSREKSIFDRLSKQNKGPYQQASIISVFREIISATRALEEPTAVAYLGPKATFTHLAATRYFGSSANLKPSQTIQSIFDAVEKGHCHYGVVPIENSTEGVVSHTLDLFVDSPLKVCAEVILKVSHHLLSQESDLKKIKTVYSHPQALAQCRLWLSKNLPDAVLKETESTALAAEKASKTKGVAAIASEIAGSVYGLPILAREIQDLSQNFTRFLVIGNHISQKTGHDKTSILFTIRDRAGGLFQILSPLAKAGINLTKVESRPLKKKAWQYLFFIDLDGHQDEPKIQKALKQVEEQCVVFQILGSYPKIA